VALRRRSLTWDGALVLQIALGAVAFPFILLHMTACYWIGAMLVYQAARRLTGGVPLARTSPEAGAAGVSELQ
jgi:hypothetical protein